MTDEYEQIRKLLRLPIDLVCDRFKNATQYRVIFLDYDGTLNLANKLPAFAQPPASVLEQIKLLIAQPRTVVYILSGRSRFHLDNWFGDIGVGLSAEHGCFVKHPIAFQKILDARFPASLGDSDEGFEVLSTSTSVDMSTQDGISTLF